MRYFTHVNTTLFAMDAAINWAAALLARLVRYFALHCISTHYVALVRYFALHCISIYYFIY